MRALLVPLGSSGDVHPFVGLGVALQARGHQVTVLTNEHFGPMIRRAGLDFAQLGGEAIYLETLANPDLWHPRKAFPLLAGTILDRTRGIYDAVEARHVPGETVAVASVLGFGARMAQERLDMPLVTVHLQPSILRSVHEPPALPGLAMRAWWPKPLKRMLYRFMDAAVIDPVLVPRTNALRAELGLPPIRRPLDHWIHSPQRVLGFFPEWFAPVQPDWPANTVLTGFPLYDERDQHVELPELEAFLAEGEPPIVFTPGTAMTHGARFFRESVAACRRLDRRGLLLTRYTEHLPAELPDSVRHFAYVPFSRVLPRAAALVHHGGIGTTAQALAAGIPQLVMPMAHDQPDNAARIERLGVGRSISPRRYEAPRVARCLAGLLESREVAARCRRYADLLARGDPLGAACRQIEALADAAPRAVA